MAGGRPDPDQLLDRIKAEEILAARGKLKIFFGASVGVGLGLALLMRGSFGRIRHVTIP